MNEKHLQNESRFIDGLKKYDGLLLHLKKIGESYDMIVQEIQCVWDRNCFKLEKIDELCLYFGSTYMKSMVRQTMKIHSQPPFETSQMWPWVGLQEQQMLLEDGIFASNPISAEPSQICGKKTG